LVALVAAEGMVIIFWLILRDKHKAGIVTSAILLALMWGWGILETGINLVFPYVKALRPPIVYGAVVGFVSILATVIFVANRDNRRRAILNTAVFLGLIGVAALAVVLFFDRVFGVIASTSILVYLALVTAGIVYLARCKRDFKPWTRTANWFGVMLVALYVSLVVYNASRETSVLPPPLEVSAEKTPAKEALPDVYVFLVEGYARCDVLLKAYSYNDLPFLEPLHHMGVRFSPDAFSNYSWDMQSVAALLNMDYLDRLLPPEAADTSGPVPLRDLYRHNRFFQILGDHGYEIAAYSPGVQALEASPLVDRNLAPPQTLTEFETVLLNNTAIRRCLEIVYFAKGRYPSAWFRAFHRARIKYVFDSIGDVAAEDHSSPRLIFAHLTIPDMPFLFGRKGGWIDPHSTKTVKELYLDQVHYTGKRLARAVEEISRRAKRPPVIVIVSSHGPAFLHTEEPTDPVALAERFGVLLGMRYPKPETVGQVDPEMGKSLVNTLRSVLNRTVNADLRLLEDQAYLTAIENPLDGTPVTIPMLETAVTPALEAP
ncbi:MAG: hypothetical protein U9Q79_06200, partial [Candidatus Hydrogenedentes bacterium]|nr:hypothetical protein [Candidatus Hydrogenedentota bacterium]